MRKIELVFLAAATCGLAPLARAADPTPDARFFESHRENFLSRLPAGSVAVLHAAAEASSSASGDPYRQDSDFWYLTGLDEPNAIAVFVAGAAPPARFLLFVAPKDFAAEQWTGWRTGVEGARKDYRAGEARPVGEFWDRFGVLAAPAQALYYRTGGDPEFERRLLEVWNASNANSTSARPTADAAPVLDSLRLIKDAIEQDLLRTASRISAEAHRAAMSKVASGRHEYDLKAAMVNVCLSRGAARMAYPPIVASGANSVILHHQKDDKELHDGEIIVNDTACEYRMYAADVTRSYPVSGRFSPEQRQIYQIVLAAQKAGFAAARPGTAFKDVHLATVGVIVDGLLKLGILTGDRDEILRTRSYQRFYPHGSSHWIGLDVHDVGSYGYPPGVTRLARYGKAETKLQPGMALTVEPGIYVPERSTADSKWWNIGVRIEDVILVTPTGMECLSCGAPSEIADLEAAIARPPAKRSASKRID
jgi:Xaa-Pro aminopeptidase